MKILFSGDWHIGLTSHSRILDGQNTRVVEMRQAIKSLVETAEKEQVRTVVQCGDIFHRSRPTNDDIRLALEAVETLIANNIDVIILDGNHDAPAQTGLTSPVELLRHAGATVYVGGEMGVMNVGPVGLYLTPYPRSFTDWGAVVLAGDINIMVGHTTLEGAVTGYEKFLLSRACHVEPHPELPTVCGHIHTPQILRKPEDNFVGYTGSLIQNDFGERDQKKGFLIFDADDSSWVFHRTAHHDLAQHSLDDFDNLDEEAVSGKIIKITGVVEESIDTIEMQRHLYSLGALYAAVDIKVRQFAAARDERMLASSGLNVLFECYCEIESVSQNAKSIGMEIIETVS